MRGKGTDSGSTAVETAFPEQHVMVAVRIVGRRTAEAPELVGVEDVIDAEQAQKTSEGVMIAASRRTERIVQTAFHGSVGIGGGQIVEVAADEYGVRRFRYLFSQIIGLAVSLTVVVEHPEEELAGGIETERPGFASFHDTATVFADAGGLEMVTEQAERTVGQFYIGYDRGVP